MGGCILGRLKSTKHSLVWLFRSIFYILFVQTWYSNGCVHLSYAETGCNAWIFWVIKRSLSKKKNVWHKKLCFIDFDAYALQSLLWGLISDMLCCYCHYYGQIFLGLQLLFPLLVLAAIASPVRF
jgi:hypothetical protein